jgi:hypothetical protein
MEDVQQSARSEFFVLAYDSTTMAVRSFTRHGHDFVGAAATLALKADQYRGDPDVVVRIYEADSFDDLPERYPDPFKDLRFGNGHS